MDFSPSDNGSIDQMLKNIASSMDQPPPPFSSSSGYSTEQILKNIRNLSNLHTFPEYTSSPSDVSLEDEKSEQEKVSQHLQRFQQTMKESEMIETSSDDDEYRPPIPASEEDLGLGLGLEGEDERDLKNTLG